MTNLLNDQQHYSEFVNNILPELGPDEVYFLSLSARNKYLTTEEREHYGLGRTEMFSRTVAISKDDFHRAMRKLGASLDYKTTKNGYRIPGKCVVVYVNINPSSMIKANQKMLSYISEEMGNATLAQARGKTPNYDGLIHSPRRLLNFVQQSTGTRHYLDIDIDSDSSYYPQKLTDTLHKYGIEYHLIETRSGYHVMVRRSDLNGSGLRLDLLIRELHETAVEEGGEVIFNKNAMIPLPGTLQGNKLVKVIYEI